MLPPSSRWYPTTTVYRVIIPEDLDLDLQSIIDHVNEMIIEIV
jgi:hypothetical protein